VAPGLDDGLGIYPTLSDAELGALVHDAQADLVCVGHTHWPLDRTVAGVRVLNPGSISNPVAPDLRAS
jgi:predicted phosphodiesterase